MGEFTGKVVLITGASSGIGAETAVLFASEGAGLALVGRDEQRLEKTAQECLGLTKDKVLTIKADMCVEDDMKRIMESTISHFGKLDVLVNNAGGGIPTSVSQENLMENYDKVITLNLRSVVHLTNLAVPHLIASKGSVVIMSSVCGKRVVDLAPKGVRVNAVNPGIIMTPLQLRFGLTVEQIQERGNKVHAMGRAGEASEVAPVIKFLASNAASFITGETLSIDGGGHCSCAR